MVMSIGSQGLWVSLLKLGRMLSFRRFLCNPPPIVCWLFMCKDKTLQSERASVGAMGLVLQTSTHQKLACENGSQWGSICLFNWFVSCPSTWRFSGIQQFIKYTHLYKGHKSSSECKTEFKKRKKKTNARDSSSNLDLILLDVYFPWNPFRVCGCPIHSTFLQVEMGKKKKSHSGKENVHLQLA